MDYFEGFKMKNDYYVYVHRRLDSNEIFYVGSGRGNRANTTGGRNRGWWYVVDSVGFKPEIICDSLSKKDSIDLEDLTIQMIDLTNLTNKQMPSHVKELVYDNFSEYFIIDKASPSGLVWIKQSGITSNVKAGSIAGHLRKTGYWSVTLKGKDYQVHRIIYLLAHGYLNSNLVIDHVDKNRSNNLIDNLRAVSPEYNSRNISKRIKKYSDLPVGVSLNKKQKSFVAQVTDPTKQLVSGANKILQKYFLISKFQSHSNPYEAAKQAAIEARKQMLEEINNRLNLGYTVDHGT